MYGKKIKRTRKPIVPKVLRYGWEYFWLRNAWLILPKTGAIVRHTIKEVREIINKGY